MQGQSSSASDSTETDLGQPNRSQTVEQDVAAVIALMLDADGDGIEEWRDVPGHADIEASSFGRLRHKGSILATIGYVDSYGYRATAITGKIRRVHTLIGPAFHGPRPEGATLIRHLDGNPLHNFADNLAWGTHADNSADMVRHGRAGRGRAEGERNGSAKLSEAQVQRMRSEWDSGATQVELSIRYGVTQATVSNIVNFKTWKHLA
jgi:hypothetical protein